MNTETITTDTITTHDGYIVDPETGEVLGHTEASERFAVTDIESAEWVLSKMQEAQADVLAQRCRLDAIQSQMQAMIEDKARRCSYLEARFGHELEAFAARELEGGKSKTLKTPFGSLSFRTVPGSIRVVNVELAVVWAETFEPKAVKVSKSVLVSGLKGMESGLPSAAFEVVPPNERFRIETGVKA
jgi:hypothetical protein